MLLVPRVDAAQFQFGGLFGQLHVNPAVGMVFAEIVTHGRLVNEMEVIALIMLPFVRVTIKVGSGMLMFGEQLQQRGSIAHALDGAYASVGVGVEVTENKGWFVRSPVEFLGKPV